MSKSRDAFRTISEVSTTLDTPAHVLRFWESKFTQVKPVKRAGGRRYYRPADVNLLAGIKQLLHEDGMTIKGAQKLLREQGVKHVTALGASALAVMEPADIETTALTVEATARTVEDTALTVEDTVDTTIVEAQTPAAPVENNTTPTAEIDITNVVKLPSNAQPAQSGPALTLNLSGPATSPAPEDADTAPTETETESAPATTDTPKLVMPDVPVDPSDSDSKRPARIFHLLQNAPYPKLAAQRDTIAPLLGRMQGLRDRIATR